MTNDFQNRLNCININGEVTQTNKVRLCKSLATLASLINQGSENLWPIFEKLEEELSNLEKNETRLLKYITQRKDQNANG